MNSVISFVIVLGLLIFVHEFGHFLLAKLCRVKVLSFSLGFGPKLIGRRYGETEYMISAFPLGGYVKMYGEKPGEAVDPAESHRSFSLKPLWQRALIVGGGPGFNLLFAVLLFTTIYLIAGFPQPIPGTKIGQVSPGSPAEQAGVLPDDIILAINGKPTAEWEDISRLVKESGGEPITLEIKRGDAVINLSGRPTRQEVTNIFGEVVDNRYLLGITRSDELIFVKVGPAEALKAGAMQTWNYVYLTIMGIVKMIQKVIPASELGGPILIAQLAGKQMEAGWLNLLYFMGIISVNLGILNLFPIPILDGGHLFFYSMEAIRRKPLSMKAQEMMQQVGLVLLVSLMVFVFYNDIVRLFNGN